MKQSLLINIAVLGLVSLVTTQVVAQQVDLSLNLIFSDPADDQSGGTWELLGRTTDSEGIMFVSANLNGIGDVNFQSPRAMSEGTLVGFEVDGIFTAESFMELTTAQVPQNQNVVQPLFYDVGVIGGGTVPGANGTPSFTLDAGSERQVPWGVDDSLGNTAWNGAVMLAMGQFDAGAIPTFVEDEGSEARSLVFTSVGDEFTFPSNAEAAITTVIRSNLGGGGFLEGDYNDSSQVEQGDLDLVLLNWGANGTPPPEGWTNDLPTGNIDQEELDGVLLNWGNTAGALGSASAVPEPATWLLLALAAVMAAGTKRLVG